MNATELISRIHEEFGVKIPFYQIFNSPTLTEMASFLELESNDWYIGIEPLEKREYYNVSSAQQRICLYTEANPDGTEYNMPGLFVLTGQLDREKFQQSLDTVILRQESLRTSFHQINGVTVQKIHEAVRCPIEFTSCSEQEAFDRIKTIVKRFNLKTPPLMRIEIFDVEPEKYILFFDIHHSVSDGFSMDIIMRELLQVYSGENIVPMDIQYKDYAEWQGSARAGDALRQSGEFWMHQLEKLSVTRIPPDHVSGYKALAGGSISMRIDGNRFQKIKSYCSENGVTRFIFLLSLFLPVLSREVEQEDITVGTPISLRDRNELKNLVGIFLNVVLLRCRLHAAKSFSDVLAIAKNTVINALNHSSYPYEWVDMKLKENQPGISEELFTILFNYFPKKDEYRIDGEEFSIVPLGNELELAPKYDVALYLVEEQDELRINLVYKVNLFEKARIQRILDGIDTLCTNIINGDNSLDSISSIPSIEEYDDFFEQMSDFYVG